MAYDHSAYLLEIAQKLKEIGHTENEPHFHRVHGLSDVEEFLANLTQTSGYQLLEETFDNTQFVRNDRPVARNYYSFYVAKDFDAGDTDSKENAKTGCISVIKKIISKYIRDYKADADLPIPNQIYGLRELEIESFSWMVIGVIGDNYMAVFVSFTLVDSPDVAYDANDWNE